MKRLNRLAARVYPAWWRERYGAEFDALLEDARPGVAGILDTFKEALIVRFSRANLAWIPLILGGMGLLLAFGMSLALKEQYQSVAVLELQMPHAEADVKNLIVPLVSRTSLTRIMQRHRLYWDVMQTTPIDQVVEIMRQAIRITGVAPSVDEKSTRFEISFVYGNRRDAQRAVVDLVEGALTNWDSEKRSISDLALLRLQTPASLPPVKRFPVNRLNLSLTGLVGGVLGGGFLALFVRRSAKTRTPLVETRQSPRYETRPNGTGDIERQNRLAALDEMSDHARLKRLSTPSPLLLPLAIGTAGLLIALGLAYSMKDRYESIATLLLRVPRGKDEGATRRLEKEEFAKLFDATLTDKNLIRIIEDHELYQSATAKKPEDLIKTMRHSIEIRPFKASNGEATTAFTISFAYENQRVAQVVVRDLVSKSLDTWRAASAQTASTGQPDRGGLSILDPPSFPDGTNFSDRLNISFGGLAGGVLTGGLFALRLRRAAKNEATSEGDATPAA